MNSKLCTPVNNGGILVINKAIVTLYKYEKCKILNLATMQLVFMKFILQILSLLFVLCLLKTNLFDI